MVKNPVGVAWIVDFSFCESVPVPQNADEFLAKIKYAAEKAGITVVKTGWDLRHPFIPDGLTLVLVLAESDITLHTWPEIKGITATLDICGKNVDLDGLVRSLAEIFNAKVVEIKAKVEREILT